MSMTHRLDAITDSREFSNKYLPIFYYMLILDVQILLLTWKNDFKVVCQI